MPLVAIGAAAGVFGLLLVARRRTDGARSAWARIRAAAAGDVRDALLARAAWPRIVLTSALVVGGHVVTFLIAARAAGVTAPPSRMVPIAALVLAVGVLPSVGGWGPREGMTAWVFGAAGLHAGRGVATAVVYGVMVLFASLPGAAVLVVTWFRGTRLSPRTEVLLREGPAHA
jgi:hypothetical protein